MRVPRINTDELVKTLFNRLFPSPSILDRVNPVVVLRFVTSYHAGSTVLQLSEVHRKHPYITEGDLLADVLGLVPRMHLVASFAGPAFLPVDVKEVHIRIAIPEAGKGRREPVEGNIAVVAVKADIIILGLVRDIELGRERILV